MVFIEPMFIIFAVNISLKTLLCVQEFKESEK